MTYAYNRDCMEAMKEFKDKHFELAIVDPPYGINVSKLAYTQEENRLCKQKNGSKLRVKKLKYEHKDWDRETPPQEYFEELKRVSIHQIIFGIEYFKWNDVGTGRIKWDKGVPEGVSFNRYETAYCSMIHHIHELPLLWAGMCQAKSLSEPMTQQGNKALNEKRIHPCHKPTLLYLKLMLTFAKPGDKILDTHLGSGSSRIAAHQLGYEFYGYELDAEYFAAQEKRFALVTSQQQIQFGT
jgi:site-specific DNA-methyltransferase (adenine-specific)